MGTLARWDRTADLATITVPTLMIGATHDTMDPTHMEMMAGLVKRGRFLLCPNGSHLAEYDDSQAYFTSVIRFTTTSQTIGSEPRYCRCRGQTRTSAHAVATLG